MANLGEGIIRALDASDWLIVVCTPDLPQSRWCLAEIEHFIRTGRRDRILTVLAAGEPEHSFPMQLRFERMSDGTIKEYEPLAADIRGVSAGAMKKRLKIEYLRLLAQMFRIGYDELRRRQRERTMRLIVGVSLAAVLFFAAFGTFALWQNRLLQRQMEETERQRSIAEEQRGIAEEQRDYAEEQQGIAEEQRSIAEEQRFVASNNELALLIEQSDMKTIRGDRYSGISSALKAYNVYSELYPGGNPDILRQINRTLSGSVYSQAFQLQQHIYNQDRLLTDFRFSPDGRYIIGLNIRSLMLIDAFSGELLDSYSSPEDITNVTVSPSGKYFFTLEKMLNRISVWETAPPLQKIAEYNIDIDLTNRICAADFFSDDTILIGGLFNNSGTKDDPRVVKWNFLSDAESNIVSDTGLFGANYLFGISALSDYIAFYIEYPGYPLHVYRISDGESFTIPMPNTGGVWRFAYSPNGKLLAGLTSNGVIIWDLENRSLLLTHDVTGAPSCIEFSPNSSFLAVNSMRGADILDIKKLKLHRNLICTDSSGDYSARFSPDGKSILVYSPFAGSIFRFPDCYRLKDFGGIDDMSIILTAFSPDCKRLVMSSASGEAGIYSTEAGATAVTRSNFTEDLFEYPSWYPENMPQLTQLNKRHNHDVSIFTADQLQANDPSGSFLCYVYPDACVEVWDLKNNPENADSVYLYHEHFALVRCVKMTTEYLITAGYDNRLIIFDLRRGVVGSSIALGEKVRDFELNHAGTSIIVQTQSGDFAYVFDLESGQLLYKFEPEPGASIDRVGFTADDDRVVAVQSNGHAIVGQLFPVFEELLEYAYGCLR